MADSQKYKPLLHDNPLCGISTYKDTLNLATGVCTRQIKKLVLTGEENWVNQSLGTTTVSITKPSNSIIPRTTTNLICTDFIPVAVESSISNTGTILVGNSYINFNYDGRNDLGAWKSHLAERYASGNPICIWYVLAEPTTETIAVPSGLSGTEEGYLNQSGTPTPTNPIYPTANEVLIWQHSLRKLTTATEAVENPLYSDGTAITAYTLKGNTVQNGAPTPSNPVDVNGVGVRTENLFDGTLLVGFYEPDINTLFTDNPNYRSFRIQGLPAGQYTISWNIPVNLVRVYYDGVLYENAGESLTSYTVTSSDGDIAFSFRDATAPTTPWSNSNTVMLNTGSTAKPFEPNGYKIPISSGGVTTNIYLGSTQTVRQVKKLVLTGTEDWIYQSDYNRFLITISDAAQFVVRQTPMLCTHYQVIDDGRPISDVPNNSVYFNNQYLCITTTDQSSKTDLNNYLAVQYAAGAPVTVWYVLATSETAAVNEPLMKIGDYADTLSNAASIPTTEGANSITVDTTVQPSEFTATWTGWHDSSVKEKSENLFDYEYYFDNKVNTGGSNDWLAYQLEPNTAYTVSCNVPYIDNLAQMFVSLSNTSPTTANNGVGLNNPRTITTDSTGVLYILSRGATAPSPLVEVTKQLWEQSNWWLMLNTGSTALPYEPYWK
ncbi:hypothetical protein [Ruminococcus flavefaciens]|uniref:hypothetical protein n=1 Tax=Ruminococcus flavefaciens TaxID=1265 RepID=UPI0026EC024A|nr:hypothetical protein [Ruminococcus flavefaciens]